MIQNNTDCLFIGHTGNSLEPFRNRLSKIAPDQQIKIENTFNLAIGYLGTYLSERGLAFDFITSFQDERNELEDKLSGGIRTVAITTTFCKHLKQIREMITFVRKRTHSVPVILGGAYIASKLKGNTKEEVDKIIRYLDADYYINSFYGEEALYQIIRAVKENTAAPNIPNMIYKTSDDYQFTPVQPENGDPEHQWINWKLFQNHIGIQVPIRTSVSCPFSCSYCTFPKYAGNYRTMSIGKIENQLQELSRYDQVKSVNFIDDTFNIPQERFKSILRMMIRNRFPFSWHSYIRCQYVDCEMAELMKESKCEGVYLGFESGNQQMLDRMNKNARIEAYIRGHDLLKQNQILTIGLFIVGFPGETKETCLDTQKFIKQIQPDFYYINPWYLDRNSSVWADREKYCIKGKENRWRHETMDDITAGAIIREMDEQLKEDSIKLHIHSNCLIQLLNQGVSVEDIRQMFRIKEKE